MASRDRLAALNAQAKALARRLKLAKQPETRKRLTAELESVRKRIRQDEPRPPIITQTFTVRGEYGRRGHKLYLTELVITHTGFAVSKEEVRQAIRDIADGQLPFGWEVEELTYGKTASASRAKDPDDLEILSAAIQNMPLTVIGENE